MFPAVNSSAVPSGCVGSAKATSATNRPGHQRSPAGLDDRLGDVDGGLLGAAGLELRDDLQEGEIRGQAHAPP